VWDTNAAAAHNQRGRALRIQGKYQEAIHELSEAIRLNPQHLSAYRNRSCVRRALRDAAGSAADERKAAS
jgi:tetratricopeptide (TPR) repeat protein